MPEMRSILFPGDTEAYEVADAKARAGVADNAAAIEGVRAGVNANAAAIAAAAINDAAIAPDRPWSSSRIVEAFCPPFAAQAGYASGGAAVQAHPFPGSELKIVTHIVPARSGSGTPSAENILPVTGWTGLQLTRCGKNLISETLNANGNVDIWGNYSNPVLLKAGVSYVLSMNHMADGLYFVDAAGNGSTEEKYLIKYQLKTHSVTYTPDRDVKCMFLAIYNSGAPDGTTMQLEIGSAATAHEAYRGDAYAAQFGKTAYGGAMDWNAGAFYCDWRLLTGSELERYEENEYGYVTYIGSLAGAEGHAGLGFVSNMFAAQERFDISSVQKNTLEYMNPGVIYVALHNSVNVNDFQFAYQLAAPAEVIRFAPQQIAALPGVNSAYSDATAITVSGRTDAAWLLGELQAAAAIE